MAGLKRNRYFKYLREPQAKIPKQTIWNRNQKVHI